MSNLKRFLAMSLVVFMMVGALAMTASAASLLTDVDPKDYKDYGDDLVAAIGLLNSLGIVKGTTANATTGEYEFSPDDKVTREQFAMFTSRIHTGTPDYFNVRYETEQDLTVFKDVNGVDPLWYQAINYCYENNIITGKTAPTEGNNDGIFGLGDSIMFQDAVTMLVRSLGYDNQGLSYPVGFLAKAREIGLLDNFGGTLSKMTAQAEITRAEMAMLLYNYFMADFYDVNLIWNQTSAKYVEQVAYKPVSEKFGITKIEGYVTAIEGAAIPMWVEDPYATTVVGAGGSVTDLNWVRIGMNDPISMRNANPDYAGNFNVVVSWVSPETVTVANGSWIENPNLPGTWTYLQASTNQRTVGHLRTTKAKLGLETDYPDLAGSRELLGLKVLAFVDSQNRPNIKLPETRVLGTKTRAVSSVVEGNILADNDRDRTLNYFEFDNGTEKIRFNQYNSIYSGSAFQSYMNDNLTGVIGQAREHEGDINRYTGYVFTSNGYGLAENVYDSRVSWYRPAHLHSFDIRYLAGVIRSGNANLGAMDIDIIDNGTNKDGTPNRYVIFTPYEAGYINNHDGRDFAHADTRAPEGWRRITRADGSSYLVDNRTTVNKFINTGDYKSASVDNNAAYFFSNQGEHIIVGKKLIEMTSNNTVGTVVDVASNGREITFNIGVANGTNSAFTATSGNIRINYGSTGTFYRTLNNRRSTTLNGAQLTPTSGIQASSTAGSGAEKTGYALAGAKVLDFAYPTNLTQFRDGSRYINYTNNVEAIVTGNTYRMWAISSDNWNYGFVGADNNTFFILKSTIATAPAGARFGYVLEVGSTSYVDGSLARQYSVWTINGSGAGKTNIINVTSPVLYGDIVKGDIIRYENIGGNTHRILGAVNPLSGPIALPRTGLMTFNAKEAFAASVITGAKGNVRIEDLVTELNKLGVSVSKDAVSTTLTDLVANSGATAVTPLVYTNWLALNSALFTGDLDGATSNAVVDSIWSAGTGTGNTTFRDAARDFNTALGVLQAIDNVSFIIPGYNSNVAQNLGSWTGDLSTAINAYGSAGTVETYAQVVDLLTKIIAAMNVSAIQNQYAPAVWSTFQTAIATVNTAITTSYSVAFNIPQARLDVITGYETAAKAALANMKLYAIASNLYDTQAIAIAETLMNAVQAWATKAGITLTLTTTGGGGTTTPTLTNWRTAYNTAGLFFRNSALDEFGNFITASQSAVMSVDTVNGIAPASATGNNGITYDYTTATLTLTTPRATTGTVQDQVFGATTGRVTSNTVIFILSGDAATPVNNQANTISMADFVSLMRTSEGALNRNMITSATALINSIGNVDTLFLRINTNNALFSKAPFVTDGSANYSATYGEYLVTAIDTNSSSFTVGGTTYRRGTARALVDGSASGSDINIAIPLYGSDGSTGATSIQVGSRVYLNTTVNDYGTTRYVAETYGQSFELSASLLDTLRVDSTLYRLIDSNNLILGTDGNLYVRNTFSGDATNWTNLGSTGISYVHYAYNSSTGAYTRQLVGTETSQPTSSWTYGSETATMINALFANRSSTNRFYLVPRASGYAIVRIAG